MTLKELIDNYFNDSWDQILSDGLGSFSPWNEVGMTWEEWSNPQKAFDFLNHFIIFKEEFDLQWGSIYHSIFEDTSYGDVIADPVSGINKKLSVKSFAGGCLFDRICYTCLRECLMKLGETVMIITGGFEGWPDLYLKIPVSLTWDDLLKGGYAITSIFNTEDGLFKVFGSKGNWGKISVNAMYPDSRDVVAFPNREVLEMYEAMLPEEWIIP